MDNYNIALAIVSVAHSLFYEMQMLSPEEQAEFEGVCFGNEELVQRFLDFITDFKSNIQFEYEISDTTCHIGNMSNHEKAEGSKWTFFCDKEKQHWMLTLDIINIKDALTKQIASELLYDEESSDDSDDDDWI